MKNLIFCAALGNEMFLIRNSGLKKPEKSNAISTGKESNERILK